MKGFMREARSLVNKTVEFSYPVPTPNGNAATIASKGFVVRLETEQEDLQPVALVVDNGSGEQLLIRPEEVTAVLRHWYVNGGGWFVTATHTKDQAKEEGMDEFGRDNVAVVRPATKEEVLCYRQATRRRASPPRRIAIAPKYRYIAAQTVLITPREAKALLAGLAALQREVTARYGPDEGYGDPFPLPMKGRSLRKRLRAAQRNGGGGQ